MNNVNIEAAMDTPKIILDYTTGLIEISGKSYPGDSRTFYASVLDWLTEYFNGNAKDKTVVNIKLKYFNSSSSQILYNIFDIINDGICNELEVNWYYYEENADSYEDYEDMDEEFPDLHINAVKF